MILMHIFAKKFNLVYKMKNLVNIVPQPQQHPNNVEWGNYC